MHLEMVAFGQWSYVLLWDEGNNVLPYLLTDSNSLLQKVATFWQPKYAAGVDLLATGTGADLQAILFAVFPGWLAYGLYKMLAALLASFFLFRLLRLRLGVAWLPALLAGILFVWFGTGFKLFDKLAVAALPAAIYALAARADRPGRGLVFAFVAGAVYGLGSQVTLSIIIIPSIFLWLWLIERIAAGRALGMVVFFAAGACAVEAHTIWAFAVNGPLSHRSGFGVEAPEFRRYLSKWIGPGLLLCVAVIARRVARTADTPPIGRTIWLFAIGAAASLYDPVTDILRAWLRDLSPFIAAYSVPKGLECGFWLAASAGASLDLICRSGLGVRLLPRRRVPVGTSAAALLIIVLAGGVLGEKVLRLWNMLYDENFATMYRHPDLQRLARTTKGAPPFRVATPFILSDGGYVLPTFLWAYGFETIDGYVSMYSKRYRDFWLQMIAVLRGTAAYQAFQGNISEIYLYGNPTDRGPPCPDGRMSCPVAFESDYNLTLLSLANTRYIVSARRLESDDLVLLPSATRDTLARTQKARLRDRVAAKLAGHYVGTPVYVYENRRVFPRYFLAASVRLFDGRDAVLDALHRAAPETLRATAFVRRDDVSAEDARRLAAISGGRAGTVDIVHQGRDRIVLNVEAPAPAVLVAANSYSPFWTATISGRAATVLPVYNTFQGIAVPAGRHRVELRYDPPYGFAAVFRGLGIGADE